MVYQALAEIYVRLFGGSLFSAPVLGIRHASERRMTWLIRHLKSHRGFLLASGSLHSSAAFATLEPEQLADILESCVDGPSPAEDNLFREVLGAISDQRVLFRLITSTQIQIRSFRRWQIADQIKDQGLMLKLALIAKEPEGSHFQSNENQSIKCLMASRISDPALLRHLYEELADPDVKMIAAAKLPDADLLLASLLSEELKLLDCLPDLQPVRGKLPLPHHVTPNIYLVMNRVDAAIFMHKSCDTWYLHGTILYARGLPSMISFPHIERYGDRYLVWTGDCGRFYEWLTGRTAPDDGGVYELRGK